MTEFKIPSRAYIIAREVLDNVLSVGDDLVSGQFAESELDTGGIEADAYFATLYADWKKAHETMGLPADDDTYRHYIYVRHLALFGIRQDNFGKFVTAEKRIPPRLEPDENLALIEEVKRDMELVHMGQARLAASGSLDYRILPNDGPGDSTRPTRHTNSIPLYRPSRPSDVFGTPDAPPVEIPNRLMRLTMALVHQEPESIAASARPIQLFAQRVGMRLADAPTPCPSVPARRRRR